MLCVHCVDTSTYYVASHHSTDDDNNDDDDDNDAMLGMEGSRLREQFVVRGKFHLLLLFPRICTDIEIGAGKETDTLDTTLPATVLCCSAIAAATE